MQARRPGKFKSDKWYFKIRHSWRCGNRCSKLVWRPKTVHYSHPSFWIPFTSLLCNSVPLKSHANRAIITPNLRRKGYNWTSPVPDRHGTQSSLHPARMALCFLVSVLRGGKWLILDRAFPLWHKSELCVNKKFHMSLGRQMLAGWGWGRKWGLIGGPAWPSTDKSVSVTDNYPTLVRNIIMWPSPITWSLSFHLFYEELLLKIYLDNWTVVLLIDPSFILELLLGMLLERKWKNCMCGSHWYFLFSCTQKPRGRVL